MTSHEPPSKDLGQGVPHADRRRVLRLVGAEGARRGAVSLVADAALAPESRSAARPRQAHRARRAMQPASPHHLGGQHLDLLDPAGVLDGPLDPESLQGPKHRNTVMASPPQGHPRRCNAPSQGRCLDGGHACAKRPKSRSCFGCFACERYGRALFDPADRSGVVCGVLLDELAHSYRYLVSLPDGGAEALAFDRAVVRGVALSRRWSSPGAGGRADEALGRSVSLRD